MKIKLLLILFFSLLLLIGCSNEMKINNQKALPKSQDTIVENAIDEPKDEIVSKASSYIYYASFPNETAYITFKEAAKTKSYNTEILTEDAVGDYAFSILKHFPESQLSINDFYHLAKEDEYTLLPMTNTATNYLFHKNIPNGYKKITNKEKQFFDQYLSFKINGCPSDLNDDLSAEDIFKNNEEGYREAKEIMDIYKTTESYLMSSIEASNHCFSNKFYNYDGINYDYIELNNEEKQEAISTAKEFLTNKEDYIHRAAIADQNNQFLDSHFATILQIQDKINENSLKQKYVTEQKENFLAMIAFAKGYREWADEPVLEFSIADDTNMISKYTTNYDNLLKELKKEEKYFAELAIEVKNEEKLSHLLK